MTRPAHWDDVQFRVAKLGIHAHRDRTLRRAAGRNAAELGVKLKEIDKKLPSSSTRPRGSRRQSCILDRTASLPSSSTMDFFRRNGWPLRTRPSTSRKKKIRSIQLTKHQVSEGCRVLEDLMTPSLRKTTDPRLFVALLHADPARAFGGPQGCRAHQLGVCCIKYDMLKRPQRQIRSRPGMQHKHEDEEDHHLLADPGRSALQESSSRLEWIYQKERRANTSSNLHGEQPRGYTSSIYRAFRHRARASPNAQVPRQDRERKLLWALAPTSRVVGLSSASCLLIMPHSGGRFARAILPRLGERQVGRYVGWSQYRGDVPRRVGPGKEPPRTRDNASLPRRRRDTTASLPAGQTEP